MTEQYEVVIVGGGQSGLALGYHLARQQRRFLIVDSGPRVGHVWRERWDSLTLLTPCAYNSLPGHPFPGDPWWFPGKDDVADYLADYARRYELPVRLNTRITSLRKSDTGYILSSEETTLEAEQVVIATGAFGEPRIPAFASNLDIFQIHSSRYKNPSSIPDGEVLIVGGGHSGVGIAQELAARRKVHLAAGNLGRLPRSVLGRDLFWWLHTLRLTEITRDSRLGRLWRSRPDFLIGDRLGMLARDHGVSVHGRVVSGAGNTVTLADGTRRAFDVIIWATGLGASYDWIDAPVFDPDGAPVHRRGATASPGLYFLGLPWQHHIDSSLLGGVARDAAYLAEQIDRHRGRLSGPRPSSWPGPP